eukprot:3096297-Amphidinium_carterae.1
MVPCAPPSQPGQPSTHIPCSTNLKYASDSGFPTPVCNASHYIAVADCSDHSPMQQTFRYHCPHNCCLSLIAHPPPCGNMFHSLRVLHAGRSTASPMIPSSSNSP